MLVDRLGLSERRACRFAGQNRSTQRHRPQAAEDDARPASGAAQALRRPAPAGATAAPTPTCSPKAGSVNRKRVQRIWREEGLRVPAKAKKRRRLGDSTVAADRLEAEYPNHVWALDYQHDATDDGRELKFLNVVDEFTREALAIEVDRSIDAEETVAVLERLAAERGAPANLRADNGPELTAAVLREWCRRGIHRHRLHRAGLALAEPLRGVLQLPPSRRAAEHRGLHLPGRRPGCSPRTGAPTTTPTIRTRRSG